MITLLLHVLRLLPFLFGGHRQLAVENLALRQQLAVYKRTTARPKLRMTDRLFWIWLARVWAGWRQPLVIVTADTVLRWQRRRFREYWSKLSGRSTRGRPAVHAEIKTLITRMATANPLWGAPRIHGELLKLGIDVAERTVSRLMPKRRPQPSHTRRPLLANHVRDVVALDFFTVPTARLRVLFVLVVLAHHRRRRPLQRDRAPHCPLDRSAAHRRLSGRLRTVLSSSRSRPDLRRALSPPREGHEYRGSRHRTAQPMAECLRRAAHWLNPTRVPESCSRSRGTTPTPHPDRLLRLLSPGSHASRARQGHTQCPARRARLGWQNR